MKVTDDEADQIIASQVKRLLRPGSPLSVKREAYVTAHQAEDRLRANVTAFLDKFDGVAAYFTPPFTSEIELDMLTRVLSGVGAEVTVDAFTTFHVRFPEDVANG
jgi:hypothetical protein